MLKSRFNLQDNEEKVTTEPTVEESLHLEQLGEALVEEHVEVEPTKYPERRLNRSEISVRLSLLGKTAEGDGYTYLKATCTGMSLTEISALKAFHHLQFINVSDNYLTLENLQVVTELPFLILIHADKNLLSSAALNKMKYMQVIIVNYNKITSVNDVYQPELCTLEAGFNKIEKVHFDNEMPHIKCLDFRYNLIKDISDFDYPKLDSLYLAGNKITSLIGIERLVNLRVLHVRNNPIKLLNGFDSRLKKLQYINLRNCKVSTLKQVKKLRILPSLETLIIRGCPCMGGTGEEEAEAGVEEEDPELRTEMLAALPRLKRLNKGVVTPEERAEAADLIKQWIEEGENDDEVEEEQHGEESSTE